MGVFFGSCGVCVCVFFWGGTYGVSGELFLFGRGGGRGLKGEPMGFVSTIVLSPHYRG